MELEPKYIATPKMPDYLGNNFSPERNICSYEYIDRTTNRKRQNCLPGLEIINEAMLKPDTIEFRPTQRLGLDACGCTGNGYC